MSFFEKTKGSISIFLILVLMPMYTCAFLAIDSARFSAAESKINGALDLSGNTALAAYNVPLRDLYGIFAMSRTEEELTEELESYFSTMLDVSKLPVTDVSFNTVFINRLIKRAFSSSKLSSNFTFENAIETKTKSFDAIYDVTSALSNSDSFEKQIISFMKYRAPYNWTIYSAKKLNAFANLEKISEILKMSSDYFSAISSVEKQFKSMADVAISIKNNPSENTEEKLQEILQLLSKIDESFFQIETKSKEWNSSIDKLDSGELRDLLKGEYAQAVNTFGNDALVDFGKKVKEDIKTLQNKQADSQEERELNCVKDPIFDYVLKSYKSNNIATSDDSSVKKIADTDLTTLYNSFDQIQFSKLLEPVIMDLICEGRLENDVLQGDSPVNTNLGYDTFATVESLLKSAGSAASATALKSFEVEYFTEMFSCFTTMATDKNLLLNAFPTSKTFGGETEYIIFGRDNKGGNMTCATNLLLAVRMLMNSIYVFTNSQMRQTAIGVASMAASVGGIGVAAAQNLFLLTLAMAESILDVSSLCKGETVPIYKSSATWTTSVNGAVGVLKDGVTNYVSRSIDDVFSVINGAAEDRLDEVVDAALSYMNRTTVASVEALTSMITTPIEAKLTTLLSGIPNVYTKEDLEGIFLEVLGDKSDASEGYIAARDVFIEYCMPVLIDELYMRLPEWYISGSSLASECAKFVEVAVADVYEELFSRLEEQVSKYQEMAKTKLLELSGQANEATKRKALGIIENYTGKLGSFFGNEGDSNRESVSTYSGIGMNYKDYMKLFALLKMSSQRGKENMLKRALIIIQINCAQQGEYFDISRCYTRVKLMSKTQINMHHIEKGGIYEY